MKTLSRTVTAALLGAAFLALATPAAADPTKKESAYGYIFQDDILNAPMMGAQGADIRVRPKPARVVLMRPRVQFVSEMLKSVENM